MMLTRYCYFSHLYKILLVGLSIVFGSIQINAYVYAEKIENLTLDRYVNDYAQMVDDQTQYSLEQQLGKFAQDHGHQILVVTVNDLDGDYIEHYSIKLAEKSKPGNAKDDNGVILLLSKSERAIRIEVGYGLEAVLTDGVSRHIISQIIPLLKNQDYNQAISQAIGQIMIVSKQQNATTTPTTPPSGFAWDQVNPFVWFVLFYVLYFVLVWLASVLGRTKSWWLGGVIGGVIALIVIIVSGMAVFTLILGILMIVLGLFFDYIVSQDYRHAVQRNDGVGPHRRSGGTWGPHEPTGWGGFGGGIDIGGFGGGGGSFGGGGASDRR